MKTLRQMERRTTMTLLTALLLTAHTLTATAGSAWWGLWNTGMGLVQRSPLYGGSNNLYVRLTAQNSRQLVGGEVSGLRFYLSDKTAVKAARVWMAATPTGEPLLSQDVGTDQLRDLLHDGQPTEVRFSGGPVAVLPATSPYASIYVGYELTLADSPTTYLMAGSGKGGPYSNFYNGIDAAESYGALALQVLASGPAIPDRSVTLLPMGEQTAVARGEGESLLTIVNQGSEPLASITYRVSIDGVEQPERTATLAEPLTEIGREATLPAGYATPAEAAVHGLGVTVTAINSQPTEQPEAVQAALIALSREAVKRTVMEEFTGTWCLNCVRGFAGIGLLEQQFGDRFIAIAMHSDDPAYDRDPMVVSHYRNSTFYKNKISILGGLPSCTIDRWIDCDPYCGYQKTGSFQTDALVSEALSRKAVADMSVTATWTDDSRTAVACDVATDFLYSTDDAHYSLILVLTADGLTGEGSRWSQNNGYNDYDGPDEALLVYAGKGYYLTDMVYNHVAVDIVGVNSGIEGSIAAPITAGQPQRFAYTLDISGNTIIQDRQQLSVVAMLIDTRNGSVVNAAKAHVGDLTAISDAPTAAPRSPRQVYDLQGRHVAAPQPKGIYIVNGRKALFSRTGTDF